MSTIEKLALQGSVNMDNSTLLFHDQLVHVRKQHIRDIVSDYLHAPCRMEHVATICGIDFINDARADNLNAAWYSLESMTKPIIWIVNNIEIKEDIGKIIPLLQNKVKAVILLNGQNSTASVFSNYVERIYKAQHIEHAVELAYTIGIPGDAVLFSPSGGEHDEDYKQKGELFSITVKKI
jgi:UDP-N-acetylmuramoylalanine--D-glutamate ligase